MAQLKDTVISGSLRVTDTIYTNILGNTLNIKGKLIVNPSYDTASNSFNEGIRINQASNGWAAINFGSAADSTTSIVDGAWFIGRRGTAGGKTGAIGDFTIEEQSSDGSGLTIHKDSGGATLYVNKTSGFGLKILNAGAIPNNTWLAGLEVVSASMAAGSNLSLAVGQAASAKNRAYIGFHYAGNESNSNYLTLGLYNTTDIIKIYGSKITEITDTLILSKDTDAAGNADNKPPLIIGTATSARHLEFDNNEIMCKSNATSTAELHFNADGGSVKINANLAAANIINSTSKTTGALVVNGGVGAAGNIYATTFNGLTLTAATTGFTIAGGTTSKTLTVNNTYTLGAACAYGVDDATANGALSTGTGLTTERSVYYGLCVINNASQTRATSIYAPTGAGTAGHVLAAVGSTSAPTWNGGLVLTGTAAASWKASFEGTTEASATAGTEAVRMKGGLRVDKVIRANKVYNAIWNDYAEYREAEISTPGACMVENDNGCLTIADARLVPGACIISDTYGFCQGETEKANVPIAVTGRVLAYTYWPREMYHAGMAVCSAPNGTIDIMTREEIRDYPDAIIGIVSEIPDYEYWGSGNIKIDNRIWIKVK